MNGQPNYFPNYSYMGFPSPTYGGAFPQRQFMQNPNQQMPQQQPMQMNNPIQQPQPQAQPQPQQAMPFVYESPIQAVRFSTEEEAKAFIVFPNSTAVFIDEAKHKIYLKTANQAGISSIRSYEESKDGADKKEDPSSQIDFDNFVKKEQLNRFVTVERYNELMGNYRALDEQLRRLQHEVNNRISTPVEQKPARPQPQAQAQSNKQ